jgi:beta-carotene ketolase (CrtW type)
MNFGVKGISISLTMISCWIISLILLLTQIDRNDFFPIIILGIAVQTFLYTGLFITAHDAMHGTITPKNRKLNNIFGSVAVRLYALFSYRKLLKKHWEHHKHPASAKDPDFHDGKHPGLFHWYTHFMLNYLSWWQLVGMAIAFNIMLNLLHIPVFNLLLFWFLPSILSTFQLFYFGTYLPHRQSEDGYTDEHRARSNNYKVFWSFLTCYHFGYHWEHHAHPNIPWWRLPSVRKKYLDTL